VPALPPTGPALLCFDGSAEAAAAIRRAGVLLAAHRAVVLSVAIPAEAELPLDPVGDLVGRLSGVYRDWDEIAGQIAAQHARAGCRLAAEAGFDATPLTAVGKPAATILEVADVHDAVVIVLGTGRHGPLSGLLGSVSARVVQESARPVLVLRSD
jgi:nucleotide-binding universal stress UspA family protein